VVRANIDARQSPIRIKAAGFSQWKKYQRPWLIRAPDQSVWNRLGQALACPKGVRSGRTHISIVGAKPCPIAFNTTDLMVLRRNGPDPLWFKAWAYQSVLTVDKTFFSRLRGLPIRLNGF